MNFQCVLNELGEELENEKASFFVLLIDSDTWNDRVQKDVTVQSRAPISSGGSATSSDTSSPQTQQETLKQQI